MSSSLIQGGIIYQPMKMKIQQHTTKLPKKYMANKQFPAVFHVISAYFPMEESGVN